MKMTRRQWIAAAGLGSGAAEMVYWRNSHRPLPYAPSRSPNRVYLPLPAGRMPMGLALSPDGKIAVGLWGASPFGPPSGSFGLSAYVCPGPGVDWQPLWEAEASDDTRTMLPPLVAAAEDCFIVAHEGVLRRFDARSGGFRQKKIVDSGNTVSALSTSLDGTVAVRGTRGVLVFDPGDERLASFDDGLNGPLALSPQGAYLALSYSRNPVPTLVLKSLSNGEDVWQASLDAFALAFSRDGSRLAVLSYAGRTWTLAILDTATGATLWKVLLDVHSTPMPYGVRRTGGVFGGSDSTLTLDFSHDGARLALAEMGRIRLFDAGNGALWRSMAANPADDSMQVPARFALFQPDGTLLVPALPYFRYLTPAQQESLPAPSRPSLAAVEKDRIVYPGTTRVQSARLSANGRTLLVAIETDTQTGSAVHWCELRDGRTKALRATLVAENLRAALSPDGKLLAMMENDFSTTLRDTATGKVLRNLPGSGFDLAFAPDGNSYAGTQGKTWTRFSTKEGKKLVEIVAEKRVVAWAFSPDGSRLARVVGDVGGACDLLLGSALRDGRADDALSLRGEHRALAFSPDGRYLACVDLVARSEGNQVRLILYDTALRTMRSHNLDNIAVEDIAFTQDGRHLTLAVYGRRQTIRLSDFATWNQVDRMDGGSTCVAPDGRTFLHAANNALTSLPAEFL